MIIDVTVNLIESEIDVSVVTTENTIAFVLIKQGGGVVPVISDLVYSALWDGNLDGASKNAIYDKIQTIVAGGATQLNELSDVGDSQHQSGRVLMGTGLEFASRLFLLNDISNLSGTPDGTLFLRDDGQWTAIPGGGDLLAANNLSDLVSAVTSRSNLGIGNIDNTSDANKPVSVAQQTALDLKYNASNPAGYINSAGAPVQMSDISDFETTTQLNTRDTNNRARVNHTGTQLANTIIDFAATVRATVLTGLSLVSAVAVTAADTILVAIGKLQAQVTINNAKVGVTTEEANTINTEVEAGMTGEDLVLNVLSCTQAEYTAGTPVATTFYIITDAV